MSETEIMDRLTRWAKIFGEPIYGGRSNPDNDMFYLLTDAKECIQGLRREARRMERAISNNAHYNGH